MADNSFSDLAPGEDVTVITAGSFQLVDIARDIIFPPLREVTAPLSPFLLDQLRNGNLRLVGSEGAPEATGGDPINGEDELKNRLATSQSLEKGVPLPSDPAPMPPVDEPISEAENPATDNEALTSSTTPRRGRPARSE